MTTKIARLDLEVPDLRGLARDADGRTEARLLALAFVMEGCTRAAAAWRCGMDPAKLNQPVDVTCCFEAGLGGF